MKYISSNKIFNRYKKLVMLLIIFMVYLIPMNVNADIVNVGDSQTFDYTGDIQEFIVPKTGIYKLETWGAQGAFSYNAGGKGAYASGKINLSKGDTLYIYVGSGGSDYGINRAYGSYLFNGASGGNYTCYAHSGGTSAYNPYGGSATDIRLVSGNWDDSASLASRIMVAAGGSSGNQNEAGVAGGTLTGLSGGHGTGGTQTSGGGPVAGSFGKAGIPVYSGGRCDNNNASGAGSGYYGGGAYNQDMSSNGQKAAGSGSSYVSGYTGCVAIQAEDNITPKTGCANGTTDVTCSYHYSGMIFEEPVMIAGNDSMPTHDGTGTMTGNEGDGYAKITFLENDNNYLSNLEVEGYILDNTFDKKLTTYSIYVSEDETSIQVNAQAEDDLATITGDGEIDISSKPSSVNITVTAEYGDVRVYTINIHYVAKNQSNVFNYTGNEQVFIAPKTGKYKLETWGAQGGNSSYNSYEATGGYGGYSEGIIELEKGDVLYINVGGKGQSVYYNTSSTPTTDDGIGYNGGGYGSYYSNNSSHGAGGGATHIATSSGLLSTFKDNTSNVLMVAGGGGGSATHVSYPSYSGTGGSGGGIKGSSGITANSTCYNYGTGGTQTSIGSYTACSSDGNTRRDEQVSSGADFGKGSNYTSNQIGTGFTYSGGGGGYYGGESGHHAPGGGGSGYIGNELLTDKKMVMYSEDETYISEDESTKTEITQDASEIPTADYAKSGNGAAKITYLPSTNNYLSNLEVEGYELKETFDKETTEYTLAVPSDTDTINIIATPEDSDVSITGTGEKSITELLTTFNIEVTAESGEVRIYTLTVRKRQLLCRRASDLHKGTLKGDSIKYGSLYTDKDTLTAEDAFTCDVNDDGVYDEDLERFYFISDYYNTVTNEFDSNYAAMLYSYNTYNGEIIKNPQENEYRLAYNNSNLVQSGPSTSFLNHLPSKEKWSNVNLYSPVRNLLYTSGKGVEYRAQSIGTADFEQVTIDYSLYGGRLVSSQELNSSGLIGDFEFPGDGASIYAYYNYQPNILQESETYIETIEFSERRAFYFPLATASNGTRISIKTGSDTNSRLRPAIDVPKNEFDLRSGNNYLSTLSVNDFLTDYDKDTMEYNIIVPYLTDTINITGTVDDVNSTATGFGEYTFDGNKMTKEIEVTAENGNKRVYTLNIEKDLTNTDLETLDIDIYGLNEKFDNNRLEYTVSISKSTTNLNISATTVEPGVVVEGIGEIEITKDLTYLPIVITAKDGTTTKTITIRILRTLCIRAKTLHQEICEEGSIYKNNGCGRDGYYLGGSKNTTTITYGNMGSGDILDVGDAFTCDVNADGQFNEENERFYYVSDYYDGETDSFNNDYATLIYYSNTLDGVPDNSDGNISYADSTVLKGPTSAYLELPSTSQWPNSVLYKQTRQINSFSGSSIKNNDNSLLQFTYTDKGSRLLTYQELASACDITLEDNNSVINECNFLFEGSVYTSVNTFSQKADFVLENPKTIDGGIYSVGGLQKLLSRTDVTSPYVRTGVRPVIDVLKQDINLYSNNNYLSNLSIDGYTLNEEFYKYNQDYTATLPAGVKNVNVIATPEDETSVVVGAGETETPLGESIINVLVTSISGEVRTYTITVTREADTNLNISEINVTGGTLNGQLDNTVNEYTIKPNDGETSITIEVIPESESATVSGNNVIVLDNNETETTITITAEDGSTREVKFTVLSYDSIEVDEENITMFASETKVIEITNGVPEGEIDIVSSDNNIASVSGLIITGVSKGETTITLLLKSDNTITKTINVTVVSDKLESETYDVLDKEKEEKPDDRIVIGAEPGTTIQEFKENMLNPANYIKIYDGDNELSDDDIVKTGLTIRLEVNGTIYDEAIIIIRGDINQDGLVNLMDKSVLSEQLLRLSDIEGYGVYAADIDNNDSINLMDKSKLSEYLLRLIDTLNE